MISDEAFTFSLDKPELLHIWRDALDGFDVKVVVTYRRPYEWLKSEHFQELREGYKRDWDVPDFVEWIRDRTRGRTIRSGTIFDLKLLEKWRAVFPNVHIFNFHGQAPSEGEDGLFERFCCQALMPEAPSTCLAARAREFRNTNTGKSPHRNKSSPQNSDRDSLALALYRANLSHLTPKDLKSKLELDSFRGEMAFPTHCLSQEELEQVLEMSLQIEKDLVPEWFASPLGEAAHRKGFQAEVERNTFCSIDSRKILKDEKLKQALLKLAGS